VSARARAALSVVVVHYRTPGLLPECVERVRVASARAGVAAQIVVVDNGADGGARSVEDRDLELLEPPENLGYAGAINLAVEGPAQGEVVIALNPDVLLEEDALLPLLAVLRDGAGIAGPRFYWDRERRLMMPPGDAQGFLEELVRILGTRSRRSAARARRLFRRHARRHWLATAPLQSYSLSGALLAIRRELFAVGAVGPFDDRYRLYYEETDWLERARRRGVKARYVPAAHAVHLYDQSAGGEVRAGDWFAAARGRYLNRRYGIAGWLLRGLERASQRAASQRPSLGPASCPGWCGAGTLAPSDLRRLSGGGETWFEVSPSPAGYPATAELRRHARGATVDPDLDWQLPADVRRYHPDRDLVLRIVEAGGEEHGPWLLERAA
jgi:GT2 family glycosyltransferase